MLVLANFSEFPQHCNGRVFQALPADAHEGHHEQMALTEAVQHLVSQPDHQMMFAALVVLAAAGGWAWRRAAK